MPWNILLLPLLGGFIFVRYWNRTKYHAIRADKERILLLAATAGVISLGLAFLVKAFSGWLFPCASFPSWPCFPSVWYRNFPFPYSAVSVLAFLLGAVAWIPLNKGVLTWTTSLSKRSFWAPFGTWFRTTTRVGWDENEEIDRVIKEDGDPLDMLLRYAEKESKTISATLTSGKIYVGFVSSTNPPTSQTRSVGIVPTKSGFRDPVTKQVHYEIYYSDALNRLNHDLDQKIAEIRGSLRARRRLTRERNRKLAKLSRPDIKSTEIDVINKEIDHLDERILELIDRNAELRKEADNVASIINDFRLVFPVSQISTISIYREEVNIEYFSHQDDGEEKPTSDVESANEDPSRTNLPKNS